MFMRSNNFKSLSHLIGRELNYEGGLSLLCPPDGSVKIVEDYKNTIILEMEWIYSMWYGYKMPSRKVRFSISKAALAVGDVRLSFKDTGHTIKPDDVSDVVYVSANA